MNETAEMTATVEGTPAKVEDSAPAANDEPVAAPAAAPAPAQAVAVRDNTALAAKNEAAAFAKQLEKQLAEMQGGDFTYGTYRVFKGNNGELCEMQGEKASCGRWAQVHLLNWDDHYEVSPGSDDKSSKDYVAYSKDGVTIDSVIGEELKPEWEGRTVAEYLQYLKKDEGFDGAEKRQFVDMACALLATDSGDGPIGKVIQVTLSQSSIPNFKRYTKDLLDTARCVSLGLPGFKLPDDPMRFFLLREAAQKGNNKWTKLSFTPTLPNKV
jgi:hypothetical protein